MLLHSFFVTDKTTELWIQYKQIQSAYNSGCKFVLFNCDKVFGPFPKNVPWDISELEEIVHKDEDVKKVLNWINVNICLRLGDVHDGSLSQSTIGVLTRIASSMLFKTNIPKDYKLMLHGNMTKNIRDEFFKLITESLPFYDNEVEDGNPF